MVLKTEKCAFSGLRVYPGHGTRLTKIDSTTFLFLNGKSKKMHAQKKKPAKLAWTTTYRKAHKKVRRTTRRGIDVEYFTSLARAPRSRATLDRSLPSLATSTPAPLARPETSRVDQCRDTTRALDDDDRRHAREETIDRLVA